MPLNLQLFPIDPSDSDWLSAFEKMQGNILRSHGREHTALLLLAFKGGNEARPALGKFAEKWCTSAADQIRQKGPYLEAKAAGVTDRQLFGSLYLSVWGYLSLGYAPKALNEYFPDSDDLTPSVFRNWFLEGMQYRGSYLGDPAPVDWDPVYRNRIEGMVLLACDDAGALGEAVAKAIADLTGVAVVLGIERGATLRSATGDALEQFGFRDGISQPHFFKGDPAYDLCQPSLVLEKDRAAEEPDAFGSYVVYRKLEQNVKAFRAAEDALADTLGLTGTDRERAGALILGRFRDGTPVTEHSAAQNEAEANNDFDFAQDASGGKCPLHAHIRKVRQRPDGRRRIVRRGVSYGDYHPSSGGPYPEGDCGLLFLSFQRDLFRQFGIIQHEWANAANFPPRTLTGKDPIVGQGFTGVPQSWPLKWDDSSAGTESVSLGDYVKFKGGEFFFAPSMSFFRRLAEQ